MDRTALWCASFVPFCEWEGKEAAAEQLAQPFCALIAYTGAGHPEHRLG